LPERHWQFEPERSESLSVVVRETTLTAGVSAAAAFSGEGDAAGSQQQPPAGSVGQQHPGRFIEDVRPCAVLAVAEFPSPARSAAAIAARAIQG
jgi:hypothetical protein